MKVLDRSSLKIKNSFFYFEIPELKKLGWLQHAFLTRRGGVSPPPYDSLNLSEENGDLKETVNKNRNLIAKTFQFDPKRLILLNQIHQDRILILKDSLEKLSSPMEYDALITHLPNTFLGILTADCLPIFIIDKEKRVVSAIHAGRQGTSLHILVKTLRKMKEEFGSDLGDLLVALGPSIGPCCYEINEEVFSPEWVPFSTLKGRGKWMVDLAKINIEQMKKEGIEDRQIFKIDLCTYCHQDIFFSYRRERRTGRQLSFIGII
ncbi:MAG: peptidoglycan editing factor PgeF [Thermodesulfobacteriota bacterium]